ncbi:hypothetical protein chiPu_0031116, partial [Chiloscyllium punctatum]|nr:hypothetical protein [Chiloscyllium punctatum]
SRPARPMMRTGVIKRAARMENSRWERAGAAALLRRLAMAEPGVELVDQLLGGLGDHGAGGEDRLGARGIQRVVILRRHHAADDDHDVLAAVLLQCGLQFRHRGEMGRGERGDAEDVDIVLDRLPRGFVRGCEQRSDIDVEADVGEGRRDHLLAAVMAVLADFCHQDARAAALGLLERIDQGLHFFDLVGHGRCLSLVDTGDGLDFGAV